MFSAAVEFHPFRLIVISVAEASPPPPSAMAPDRMTNRMPLAEAEPPLTPPTHPPFGQGKEQTKNAYLVLRGSAALRDARGARVPPWPYMWSAAGGLLGLGPQL